MSKKRLEEVLLVFSESQQAVPSQSSALVFLIQLGRLDLLFPMFDLTPSLFDSFFQ